MNDTEQLWRKTAHHFVIEMQVGKAWVRFGESTQDHGRARAMALEALDEPAVAAVRLLEHEVESRCYLREDFQSAPALRIPPKMTPTGRMAACRSCSTADQPVVDDGTTEWVFCAKCARAVPA